MHLGILVPLLPPVLGPGVPTATEAPPINQLTPESTLAQDVRYLKAVNYLQVGFCWQ